MKKQNIISILAVVAFAMTMVSCFSDDTTLGDRPLSDIYIDSMSVKTVYNVNKNSTLHISPVISQTNTQKELTYTWEINQEVFSHEKELDYPAKYLGTYPARLIVENEDGKSFFAFTINVNTIYEEGIAVLSNDGEGRSMLSFMLTPTDAQDSRYFYEGDCFAANNDDTFFASNAVDMVQSSGSLILVCQGNSKWQDNHNANPKYEDVPTLYYLNEKTFVAENILKVAEYADFCPTHIVLPSEGASGVAYPILCKNGNIYEFSSTEGAVARPTKLPYNYAQTCMVHDDGSGMSFELIFWDKTVKGLCEVYSGYGPYYCGEEYHLSRDACSGSKNFFNGLDIVKIVPISYTKSQSSENPQMLVLTKNAFATRRVIMSTTFWSHDYSLGVNYLDYTENSNVGVGTNILNENTPCVANLTYRSMLFADGNKVRRWYYSSTQVDLHSAPTLQTFGSASAKVTDLVLSADHKTTYVAFYEPEKSGLNGSIYVIDTDTGEILERHENVCYKPVKMIYKKK